MRVVLDTNVMVSGLMTPDGTCGRVVDLFLGDIIELCVDDRIINEYTDVLRRPEFRIEPEEAGEVIGLVRTKAHLTPAAPLPVALPDSDDLPFLEVAAAAEAMLVTGNSRHFPEKSRASVVVLSPADLLEIVRSAR